MEKNFKLSDVEYVYPTQSSSSQCRGVDYQFLFIYDKEFDLRCVMTAGVLGVYNSQWTEVENVCHHTVAKVYINISFTNYWSSHGDLWGQIVYIPPALADLPDGFYIWAVNHKEQLVYLIPFMGTFGHLQILDTLQLAPLEGTRVYYYSKQECWAAKTAYGDFYRNQECLDCHASSYTDNIVHIIDELLSQIDLPDERIESDHQQVEYCEHQLAVFPSDHCEISGSTNEVEEFVHSFNHHTRCNIICDFIIHDKTVGYLT